MTPTANLTIVQTFKSSERFYTLSVIAFGVVGNVCSALVLIATKLRSLSSSSYLAALAISDACFLCTLTLIWLPTTFGQPHFWWTDGICQFVLYSLNVFGLYSTLLVVCFTAERYAAIKHPLAGRDWKLGRHHRVLLLLALSLLYYSYLPFVTDNQPVCGTALNPKLTVFLHGLDVCLVYLLPTLAIGLLNVGLGKALFLNNQWQRNNSNRGTQNLSDSQRSERKVTRGLMIISVAFATLNLPHNICTSIRFISELVHLEWTGGQAWYIIESISSALYYTNFALDFVLYHITSSNYRKTINTLSSSLRKRLSLSRSKNEHKTHVSEVQPLQEL